MIENNNTDFSLETEEFERMLAEFISEGFKVADDSESSASDPELTPECVDAEPGEAQHSRAPRALSYDGCAYESVFDVAGASMAEARSVAITANGENITRQRRPAAFIREEHGAIEINVVVDVDRYDEEVCATLYKKGRPDELAHCISTPEYGSVYFCLRYEDAMPGETYLIALEDIDITGDCGHAVNVGQASIFEFKVLPHGSMLPIANVHSVKAPKVDQFVIGLDTKVDSDCLFETVLYDLESLTIVTQGGGRGKSRKSPSIAINVGRDELGYQPGRYALAISRNKAPLAIATLLREGKEWKVESIANRPGSGPMGALATVSCLVDTDVSRDWLRLASRPGLLGLKRLALDKLPMSIASSSRSKAGYPSMAARLAFCYDAKMSDSAKKDINLLATILGYDDVEVFDAQAALAQKESNMPRLDDDDSVFNSRSILIANPMALLNPRMGEYVRKVSDALEFASFAVLLCSEQAARAIFDVHPQLGRRIDRCVAADTLGVNDIVRKLLRRVENNGNVVNYGDEDKIIAKARKAIGSDRWTMEEVDDYYERVFVPRFLTRLSQIDEKRQDRVTLGVARACDFVFDRRPDAGDVYADGIRELNALVGLGELKGKLGALFDRLRFDNLRRSRGLYAGGEASYHTIFTGNPGTGKTTVAKLMGKIYHSLGIISKGDAVIVDRCRIVGQFIGDTEANMRNLIESARGCVLFIDEAYSLKSDPTDKRDFGGHALEVLLPVLSQANPDMVVVFAGYEKEMQVMMDADPGLASRFSVKLNFPDYTAGELTQIAERMAAKFGFDLAPDAKEALSEAVARVVAGKHKNFGNARWAEQLVEHGILPAMAQRVMALAAPTDADLTMITRGDIAAGILAMAPAPAHGRQALGFR